MKSIAIIPARGGSKRIPRKNIRPFLGKPIIQYSIEAALSSELFDEVMVSTDDQEIAEVAKKCGAHVPFMRSAENSTDMAMTAPVLIEVIKKYQEQQQMFDVTCCIYPTAPFVSVKRLQEAHKLLTSSKADGALPVVRFSYPIQRCLRIKDDRATMFWPENYNVRSQDLEPAYHDCGQFYMLRTASLLKQQVLFPEYTIPLEIDDTEAQDIDNETDWKLAELKYRFIHDLA